MRTHRKDRTDHNTGRVTSKQRVKNTVQITLTNISDEEVDVVVHERVAVSELASVTVTIEEASPNLNQPVDGDGMVGWEVSVAPGARKRLDLVWVVEAGANVRLPPM